MSLSVFVHGIIGVEFSARDISTKRSRAICKFCEREFFADTEDLKECPDCEAVLTYEDFYQVTDEFFKFISNHYDKDQVEELKYNVAHCDFTDFSIHVMDTAISDKELEISIDTVELETDERSRNNYQDYNSIITFDKYEALYSTDYEKFDKKYIDMDRRYAIGLRLFCITEKYEQDIFTAARIEQLAYKFQLMKKIFESAGIFKDKPIQLYVVQHVW